MKCFFPYECVRLATRAGKAGMAGIAGKAGISYLLEEIVLDGWNSMQYFKTRPL